MRGHPQTPGTLCEPAVEEQAWRIPETETFSKEQLFNLTPTLDARLRDFAKERGWYISATIRYFIELGMDTEARRAELAKEAENCWPGHA